MKLFVSPHNDDAVLFGCFTLQRERPEVLTVFDSFVQPARGHRACTAAVRRREDCDAIELACGLRVHFGCVRDDAPGLGVEVALETFAGGVDEVWLPATEPGGHEQHNLVSRAGLQVFGGRAAIHWYLTYTDQGKSRSDREVIPTGRMVRTKLEALACYRTQLEIDALGCWPHFLDLREYLA